VPIARASQAFKYPIRLLRIVRILPSRRYLPWLLLGVVVTMILDAVLLIPLVATALVSLILTFVAPNHLGRVRKFFRFFLSIFGIKYMVVGALLLVGYNLSPAITSAVAFVASMFVALPVFVLAVFILIIGVILLVLGNSLDD
jgi:hypothetical protein